MRVTNTCDAFAFPLHICLRTDEETQLQDILLSGKSVTKLCSQTHLFHAHSHSERISRFRSPEGKTRPTRASYKTLTVPCLNETLCSVFRLEILTAGITAVFVIAGSHTKTETRDIPERKREPGHKFTGKERAPFYLS